MLAWLRIGVHDNEWSPGSRDAMLPAVLVDRVGLTEEMRTTLERIMARHCTLADVIRWGVVQSPPCIVADVVIQDEYTHDVIVPYRGGLHLIYDVT